MHPAVRNSNSKHLIQMPLVIISYNVVTVVYCKKWRAYLIKRLSLSEIYKAITDVVPGPNSFNESCFLI